MYSATNIARYGQLFKAAHADVLSNGKIASLSGTLAGMGRGLKTLPGLLGRNPAFTTGLMAAPLALGLGGGGLIGQHLQAKKDEEERLKTRNRAFGAGMGAGVALPAIGRQMVPALQSYGILPGGGGL